MYPTRLIERQEFLDALHEQFSKVKTGEGHASFICGEAGIGKTALVKSFNRLISQDTRVLIGTCDAMFTPRPLSPVLDIMDQLEDADAKFDPGVTDRTDYFTNVFRFLKKQEKPVVITFEDIHWADEATLDFIKFLCRRIAQLPVLFIMTFRDNEIQGNHPLRNVLGQLIPGSYSRFNIPPLSEEAVSRMVVESGRQRKDIYRISGGNPFYVQELLASYLVEIPSTISDSILFSYNQCDTAQKKLWDILSVLPAGLELDFLGRISPDYVEEVARCITYKILVIENNSIRFKHELFRQTIENSLSPFRRISLNKNILDVFSADFEKNGQIERLVHHAKGANDFEKVVHYAPEAAHRAAQMGAHIEAARLYMTSFEYYRGNDNNLLVELYEKYAYECYLTLQIKNAIIYTSKVFDIYQEKEDVRMMGNSLRFLSRLWWYDGNRKKAEEFGVSAIEVLENVEDCKEKAMAWSNMSQLKMLADQTEECVKWGEKAISLAKEIKDEETLIHALNNVGTVLLKHPENREKGLKMLRQSLETALKNGFQEHAARAFTNMGSAPVKYMDYASAESVLSEGIKYCEEHDLNSWSTYMSSWKARLLLETGKWEEAMQICSVLLDMETTPIVRITALVVTGTIKMRRGEESLPLLNDARTLAFATMEVQRVYPVIRAMLEYEWIYGKELLENHEIESMKELFQNSDNRSDYCNFVFWYSKARGISDEKQAVELYNYSNEKDSLKASLQWKKIGCPYEEAIVLSSADEEGKLRALELLKQLGANAVVEKLKALMRLSGIKSIPRGKRKSTMSNSAQLTRREISIVELLKDGLQNKEIAEKLFISPKTVDHHISSILDKLEVNSRNKAAQEAIRLGIIK